MTFAPATDLQCYAPTSTDTLLQRFVTLDVTFHHSTLTFLEPKTSVSITATTPDSPISHDKTTPLNPDAENPLNEEIFP